MFDFLARGRRARLRAVHFPKAWLAILSSNVPLYQQLSPALQERVQGDIQVLLAEKHFEGCGGLRIDDEIRVTIAAHAALLMLGGEPRYYPGLDSILVYPSAYLLPVKERDGVAVREGKVPLLGESSREGVVVLAWDASLKGAREPHDGENTILHEFAHQLDTEDGAANGAPLLETGRQYIAWARAMKPEYDQLRAHPEGDIIRSYGATNPAEFFAVITEVFFERPTELRERHPALYAELSGFYGLDLASDPPGTRSKAPA